MLMYIGAIRSTKIFQIYSSILYTYTNYWKIGLSDLICLFPFKIIDISQNMKPLIRNI